MRATNTPAPFLLLPGELLLHILSFLDIQEVLTLRQTCTVLHGVTHTQSLWVALLYQQQETHPLPPHLSRPVDSRASSNSLLELPTSELETGVTDAYRVARLWAQPRTQQPTKLTPKTGDSLLSLEIFLDRWLLCAYSEGLVYLWDLSTLTHPYNVASSSVPQSTILDLGSENWASTSSALSPSKTQVIVALTRSSIPAITQIHRVQLHDSEFGFGPNPFEHLHTLVNPVAQIARAIEPGLQLMILSSANTVDVIVVNTSNISSPPDTSGKAMNSKMSISPHSDDFDDVFNGIISSRIMGPYVVLFKSRSIELHPLVAENGQARPAPDSNDLRVLKYQFGSVTFRILSPSDSVLTQESLSFSFLGYDFLQGIFHFNVAVRFTPGGASLEVDCVGVYAMADNIDMVALFPPSSSISTPGSAQIGIFGPSSNRVGANAGSRGFVSAMALGPQGKRAVWVERKRGNLVREVLVWNRAGSGQDGKGGIIIPRRVVYRLESYDLREDLTHCAIGEVGGRIILGNRAGDVFVLGLDP